MFRERSVTPVGGDGRFTNMHESIIKGMERELQQVKRRIASTRIFRAYAKETGGVEREVTQELIAQDRQLAEELERWLAELKGKG